MAVLLMVWCWHGPMFFEMQLLSKRLVVLRAERQDLDDLSATMARIDSVTDTMEQRLAAYESDILVAGDGVYLHVVSRAQERCGVELEQMRPGAMVSGGPGAYNYIPVSVVSRGTFAEALCFIYELETGAWSARLVSLRIHTDTQATSCQTEMEVHFYIGPEPRRTEPQITWADRSAPVEA